MPVATSRITAIPIMPALKEPVVSFSKPTM